jgi:uncharacterized protein (TIGR04255 family)
VARIRHLDHAPIIEALIDFRVDVPAGTTVELLEQELENHAFGYRKIGPIFRGNFGMTFNPQEAPAAKALLGETKTLGFRFQSSDNKYVAQFTTEGFTLSRLEPYESWDTLISETQRVWRIYQACVASTRVSRTATRFINNLRLPLKPGDRFETYLAGLPSMPADYPQAISSFLQRFVVYEEKTGATAVLTQALEQTPTEPPVPVILDIDVFRETKFTPDGPETWDFLGELHDLKNRFFFGAITESAADLYA